MKPQNNKVENNIPVQEEVQEIAEALVEYL